MSAFCSDCPQDGRCFDKCFRLQKSNASRYAPHIKIVGGLQRGEVRCAPCGATYKLGQRHGDCKIYPSAK